MITNKQLDRICDLLVDYRKAIVELTTAAPEDRRDAAYEFAAIDQTVHELLASWVGTEATKTADDGWIEWVGGTQPVEDSRCVEVRFKNGVVAEEVACWLDWSFDFEEEDGHIVAYRVVS